MWEALVIAGPQHQVCHLILLSLTVGNGVPADTCPHLSNRRRKVEGGVGTSNQ